MKPAAFLLQPEPGKIIQIYVRHCRFDFLHGYCRGILHVGRHVRFVMGFRCCENPSMTLRWAEPHDFGIQLIEGYSFNFTPEAEWMGLNKPPQISP